MLDTPDTLALTKTGYQKALLMRVTHVSATIVPQDMFGRTYDVYFLLFPSTEVDSCCTVAKQNFLWCST